MERTNELLEAILRSQEELTTQVKGLVSSQNELKDAQDDMSACLAALDQRFSAEVQPAETVRQTVRRVNLPLDAGVRLASTPELLELILLELPPRDLLLSQRINRQFSQVIVGSPLIQQRLCFSVEPALSENAEIVINPIFTERSVMSKWPLWFDHASKRLAYCARDGRERIRCTSIKVGDRAGRACVDMVLRAEIHTEFEPDRDNGPPLGAGSWKNMHLSRPACDVRWRFYAGHSWTDDMYHGTVPGEQTLDELLESLADCVPECSEAQSGGRSQ